MIGMMGESCSPRICMPSLTRPLRSMFELRRSASIFFRPSPSFSGSLSMMMRSACSTCAATTGLIALCWIMPAHSTRSLSITTLSAAM